MKIVLFFLLFSSVSIAQPVITLLGENVIQLDTIISGNRLTHHCHFVNTGNEPLIVSRARTNDGGSMANYSREPVMPGDSGKVEFIYDTKRIGPINRSMTIESNAENKYLRLRFKGLVIHPPATIKLDQTIQPVGTIQYNDTKTVVFHLTNDSEHPLIIHPTYGYPECDLLSIEMIPSSPEKHRFNGYTFSPHQQVEIRIKLRNTYGNVGSFQRYFYLKYNSLDTLCLQINGTYSGNPETSSHYEDRSLLTYEDGKLIKKEDFRLNGTQEHIWYYKRSSCSHRTYFSGYPNKAKSTFYHSKGKQVNIIEHEQ